MVEVVIWCVVSMRKGFVFELQQHRRKTSVFVLLVFLLFAMCALDGLAGLASVQCVAVNNVKNERQK